MACYQPCEQEMSMKTHSYFAVAVVAHVLILICQYMSMWGWGQDWMQPFQMQRLACSKKHAHVHVRDGYPAIQYLPRSNIKWDTYSGYSAVFVFSPPTEGNMSAWITIVKLYDCSSETKITDYFSGALSKNTTPRYSSKRHLQLCACERCTPTKSLQLRKTEVTISIQSVKVTQAKIMLYTERNHMKQYEPIWSAWRHVIVVKLLTSWLCEGIWRDYHGVIGCETNLQMIWLASKNHKHHFSGLTLAGWGQNIPNSTQWCWRPGQRSPSPPRHTSLPFISIIVDSQKGLKPICRIFFNSRIWI